MESQDRSELIKNRFKKVVQNNELNMHDGIEILEFLFNEMNFKTIQNYAASENISYNGAKRRIINNRVMALEFDGIKYIS